MTAPEVASRGVRNLNVGYEEAVPLDSLVDDPVNPNVGDVDTVREMIEENGWYGVIVADVETRTIVAGHHRKKALLAEGETAAPVVWIRTDAEDHRRRILVGDNRSTRLGRDDPEMLSALLAGFAETERALAGTGYTDGDLAALMDALSPPAQAAAEPEIPPEPADPVTRRGDIWHLGRHRLLCGDCRDAADVQRIVDIDRVNVAVTSPPYADQRTYDESSGFRPIHPDEYVSWFAPVASNVAAVLADDGSWFVNIKPPGIDLDTHLYVHDLVAAHVRRWGWHFATEFCWERIGVPKQVVLRFKNQFEPVYQFTRGRWKIRPYNVAHPSEDAIIPFGPGRGNTSWADPDSAVVSQGQRGDLFEGQRVGKGRGNTSWKNRQGASGGALPSDVRRGVASGDHGAVIGSGLAFPGNRLSTFVGTHEATGHTAAFPVGLPGWFIRAFSDPDDVVFDPFVGSGSTILAAEREGRIGLGIEISPGYCDVVCARFQKTTGIVPRTADGDEVDFIA